MKISHTLLFIGILLMSLSATILPDKALSGDAVLIAGAIFVAIGVKQ